MHRGASWSLDWGQACRINEWKQKGTPVTIWISSGAQGYPETWHKILWAEQLHTPWKEFPLKSHQKHKYGTFSKSVLMHPMGVQSDTFLQEVCEAQNQEVFLPAGLCNPKVILEWMKYPSSEHTVILNLKGVVFALSEGECQFSVDNYFYKMVNSKK